MFVKLAECGVNRHTGLQLATDELWVFSTTRKEWTLAANAGERPSVRYGHAMTAVGSDLYVYGGRETDDTQWVFSTTRMEWNLETVADGGTNPNVRDYHAMTVVGFEIYVFGGRTSGGVCVLTSCLKSA